MLSHIELALSYSLPVEDANYLLHLLLAYPCLPYLPYACASHSVRPSAHMELATRWVVDYQVPSFCGTQALNYYTDWYPQEIESEGTQNTTTQEIIAETTSSCVATTHARFDSVSIWSDPLIVSIGSATVSNI